MIWFVPGIMGENADQHVSECRLEEESGYQLNTQMYGWEREKGKRLKVKGGRQSSVISSHSFAPPELMKLRESTRWIGGMGLYPPAGRGGWRGSQRRRTSTPTMSRRPCQLGCPKLSEHWVGFHFLYFSYFLTWLTSTCFATFHTLAGDTGKFLSCWILYLASWIMNLILSL